MCAVIGGLEWFQDQEKYWASENQLLQNPTLFLPYVGWTKIYSPERKFTSVKYLKGKLFPTKRISSSRTKKQHTHVHIHTHNPKSVWKAKIWLTLLTRIAPEEVVQWWLIPRRGHHSAAGIKKMFMELYSQCLGFLVSSSANQYQILSLFFLRISLSSHHLA